MRNDDGQFNQDFIKDILKSEDSKKISVEIEGILATDEAGRIDQLRKSIALKKLLTALAAITENDDGTIIISKTSTESDHKALENTLNAIKSAIAEQSSTLATAISSEPLIIDSDKLKAIATPVLQKILGTSIDPGKLQVTNFDKTQETWTLTYDQASIIQNRKVTSAKGFPGENGDLKAILELLKERARLDNTPRSYEIKSPLTASKLQELKDDIFKDDPGLASCVNLFCNTLEPAIATDLTNPGNASVQPDPDGIPTPNNSYENLLSQAKDPSISIETRIQIARNALGRIKAQLKTDTGEWMALIDHCIEHAGDQQAAVLKAIATDSQKTDRPSWYSREDNKQLAYLKNLIETNNTYTAQILLEIADKNFFKPLLETAIKNNNIAAVKALLENKHIKNPTTYISLLQQAIKQNNLEIIAELFNTAATIQPPIFDEKTLAELVNIDTFKALLLEGKLNLKNYQQALFRLAINNKHEKIIDHLLAKDDKKQLSNGSSLRAAIDANDTATLQKLVKTINLDVMIENFRLYQDAIFDYKDSLETLMFAESGILDKLLELDSITADNFDMIEFALKRLLHKKVQIDVSNQCFRTSRGAVLKFEKIDALYDAVGKIEEINYSRIKAAEKTIGKLDLRLYNPLDSIVEIDDIETFLELVELTDDYTEITEFDTILHITEKFINDTTIIKSDSVEIGGGIAVEFKTIRKFALAVANTTNIDPKQKHDILENIYKLQSKAAAGIEILNKQTLRDIAKAEIEHRPPPQRVLTSQELIAVIPMMLLCANLLKDSTRRQTAIKLLSLLNNCAQNGLDAHPQAVKHLLTVAYGLFKKEPKASLEKTAKLIGEIIRQQQDLPVKTELSKLATSISC